MRFKWIRMMLFAAAIPSGYAVPPYLPPETPLPAGRPIPIEEVAFPLDGGEFRMADWLRSRSLNGPWRISTLESSDRPFPEEAPGFEAPDFDDSGWAEIEVPLDWYEKFPEVRRGNDTFVRGWYRRSVELTAAELDGRRTVLHFGVAGYRAVLFVNGRLAGTHTGEFVPWQIDVTDFVKPGRNTLALRIDSDFGKLFGNIARVTHTYGSQWGKSNIRAGLWRDVKLEFKPRLRFTRLLIDPQIGSGSAEVRYEIDNPGPETAELTLRAFVSSASADAAGKIAGTGTPRTLRLQPGRNTGEFSVAIPDCRLWSPEDPHLYFMTVLLADATPRILSAESVRFGMREFKIDGTHFYLNGKRIFLFGENMASINYEGRTPDSGADRRKIYDHLAAFRRNGYNMIRNGHMPLPEYYAEYADELGMMLYNEWSWCFVGDIDEKLFEENNLREFGQWLERDYNHPSVVMYSGGNEIGNGSAPEVARQLDKQYRFQKQFDRSGRPFCSFSGNGLAYVPTPLAGDFLDAHIYYGISHMTWTLARRSIRSGIVGAMRAIYQDGDRLKRPLVSWEWGGFSWGDRVDRKARLGTVDDYARYADELSRSSVGSPRAITYGGSIGVESALRKGNEWARSLFGRRLGEVLRQIPEIQGFAPWYQDSSLKTARLWNQPVLVGLRHRESLLPPHNIFAGRALERELVVVNSGGGALDNLTVEFELACDKGAVIPLGTRPVPPVGFWEIGAFPIALPIPETVPADANQLRLTLRDSSGKVISVNYYDVLIQSAARLAEPVPSRRRTALVDHGDELSVGRVGTVLQTLKVPFDRIAPEIAAFDAYELVILPPSRDGVRTTLPASREMLGFVRRGGWILQLEQAAGAPQLFDAVAPVGAPNSLVELCVWNHPVFAGIPRGGFDVWENPDAGLVIKTALLPFNRNALAARGPFMHQKTVFSAVTEARLGRGRLLASQLEATALWNIDCVASLYLRNLIGYMVGGEPVGGTLPLAGFSAGNYDVDPARVTPVDLTKFVTRGFADDKDNDGAGGWTDQGRNDFRAMPLGRISAAGVPFDIIDPAGNGGKSCIVLRGDMRPAFPASVTGIAVGRKFGRLFFLHGCAWGKDLEVGRYRIRYADGVETDFVLTEGQNIGDWWNCVNLPKARIGVSRIAEGVRSIGLGVAVWVNPRPGVEIAAIDFLSAGAGNRDKVDYIPSGSGVPVLVAISGEDPGAQKLVFGGDDDLAFYDPIGIKGPKPVVAYPGGDGLPEHSARIEIPGKRDKPGYVGAVIVRFSADSYEAVKPKAITFRARAAQTVTLRAELPESEWRGALFTPVHIEGGNEWRTIRLELDRMSRRGEFPTGRLRGELLLHGGPDPVIFEIGAPAFE